MPEIVCNLLCKVQQLFTYQGVYTHYYTLLPTLVVLMNIHSLCTRLYRYLQHKSYVTVSVDSGNTLYLKMQNRMRIENVEVDDATVCPSVSFAMRVRACIGACVCMHFYNVLDCSWYGPETDPGYWQGGNWDSR